MPEYVSKGCMYALLPVLSTLSATAVGQMEFLGKCALFEPPWGLRVPRAHWVYARRAGVAASADDIPSKHNQHTAPQEFILAMLMHRRRNLAVGVEGGVDLRAVQQQSCILVVHPPSVYNHQQYIMFECPQM